MQAQTASRLGQTLDLNARVTTRASVPPQIRIAQDLGRVSPSRPIKDMLLRLTPSADQAAALQTFLGDVQNRNSPNYQHWLTPREFGERFSVSDADLQKVVGWLGNSGFTIEEVSAGKRWIRFSGTAAQVEQTFETEVHSYSKAKSTYYANAKEISIPAALAPVVSGLVTLNSFQKAPQHTQVATVARTADGKLSRVGGGAATQKAADTLAADPQNPALATHTEFTSPGTPEATFLAPGDFSKIYDTAPLLKGGTDGSGVSIAIVGRSDISLSDVEAFRTVFRLPFNDPHKLYVNANPGVVVGDDEEAILDTEWSGAVAPKATINYVIASSTDSTDGVDIASSYIVDHVTSPIMSVSFGICEQAISQNENDFYRDLWQQASAEGITVLVSAGDSGSSSCDVPQEYLATQYGLGVNALASTPYNVAVGGTEFADTNLDTYWAVTPAADQSTAKGYIPEIVWNESCNANLPVSLHNCYFGTANEGTYAGGGGSSSCSVHPDGDTPNGTGLYDCQSGYPKPAWQTGRGVPQDGARDVPDVSLAAAGAHDGYLICYDGSCQWAANPDGSLKLEQASVVGGTSVSSPSMAGILALVEQKNGLFQGQADYKLYELAAQQGTTDSCNASKLANPSEPDQCVFRDLTAGTNTLSCTLHLLHYPDPGCTVHVPGNTVFGYLSGYDATPGYDRASGLGSVNAANLVKAWATFPSSETATTLSVSRTKFVHGSTVEVVSDVTATSGSGMSPTGEVTLRVKGGTTPVGPALAGSLVSGRFQQPVSNLPGGTYSLIARYGGDGHYEGSSSAPVSLVISPEASSVAVKTFVATAFNLLNEPTIVPGNEVELTTPFYVQATVNGASGAGIATGNVELSEGGKRLGTYPLDQTGAIYVPCGPLTLCDLGVGHHTLTARYVGDSSFTPSATNFPFIIDRGTTHVSLALSSTNPPPNSIVFGSVYFKYDPIAVPTGQVKLTRDDTGAVLGVGLVKPDGTALIPFRAQPGSYNVVESYTGDANYTQASIPGSAFLTTSQAGSPTTITVTLNSSKAELGGRTEVNVTVTPVQKKSAVPTGAVTLYMLDGASTQPLPLTGGHLSTFLAWPSAGAQKFYASYGGDQKYNGASSSLFTVQVAKAMPIMAVKVRSTVLTEGSEASITALLSSRLSPDAVNFPTGEVRFTDSVNGRPPHALGRAQALNTGNGGSLLVTIAPVLGTGTHTITAIYEGDRNWTRVEGVPIQIHVSSSTSESASTP